MSPSFSAVSELQPASELLAALADVLRARGNAVVRFRSSSRHPLGRAADERGCGRDGRAQPRRGSGLRRAEALGSSSRLRSWQRTRPLPPSPRPRTHPPPSTRDQPGWRRIRRASVDGGRPPSCIRPVAFPGLDEVSRVRRVAFPGLGTASRVRRVAFPGLGAASRVRRVAFPGLGAASRVRRVAFPGLGAASRVGQVDSAGFNPCPCPARACRWAFVRARHRWPPTRAFFCSPTACPRPGAPRRWRSRAWASTRSRVDPHRIGTRLPHSVGHETHGPPLNRRRR